MMRQSARTRFVSTAEVASRAGVHRDTLLRWLRDELVPEPARDERGWRIFSDDEAQAIVDFAKYRQGGLESGAALVRAYRPEIKRLESIDWNFVDANTSYLTHALHPYPAKFIPQIPNALIQELSSVGDTVADIFCGSGTTLVEALLLKRHAIGVDANPLACLVSRAKTTTLTEGDYEALHHLARRAADLGNSLAMQGENLLFDFAPFTSSAPRPEADAIDFWFERSVVEELAEIRAWSHALPSQTSQTIALAALSSIIVTVSKQDSDTRYVRREKDIQPGEVFRRFARSLRDSLRGAAELTELVEPRFRCEIFEADVLGAPDIGEVDLVVCSPPYPNAYSYHLYHRTRMLWLEMDQPRFKQEEIGSHRKYSRKGDNAATPETFQKEMGAVFRWLNEHLRPNAYACFVIGNSTIRGKEIDNATLIASAASPSGFREISRIERQLQATKKAFNPAIGRIKTEHILVFHKPRIGTAL